MNGILIKDEIENMIYEIRGKQVMLDSDLARLYNCKNGTKTINLAVKRNINRFPERFMFQLTKDELLQLRFQTETTNSMSRSLPYVFTEQGIAMLATILKTPVATEVSIRIMDAFVIFKKYISINNYDKRISNLEIKYLEHDNKFDEIFSKLDKTVNNHIFFEGQIYDAYSLLVDILNISKENIIIIDNYIGKNILDIVSKVNSKILIITSKINEIDLNKYNEQYKNIEIRKSNKYHDRFIIIDKKILYHFGSSFKDLGNKCFAINKIEDNYILDELLKHILNALN